MIDVESLSFSYVSELTEIASRPTRGVDVSARPGTLTLAGLRLWEVERSCGR